MNTVCFCSPVLLNISRELPWALKGLCSRTIAVMERDRAKRRGAGMCSKVRANGKLFPPTCYRWKFIQWGLFCGTRNTRNTFTCRATFFRSDPNAPPIDNELIVCLLVAFTAEPSEENERLKNPFDVKSAT